MRVNLSFDGADWYSFINHFELLARKHHWDKERKVIHLVTALKGRAERATHMKGIGEMSYKKVVTLIERKVGQNKPLITTRAVP